MPGVQALAKELADLRRNCTIARCAGGISGGALGASAGPTGCVGLGQECV
jgi:hypothetical protein